MVDLSTSPMQPDGSFFLVSGCLDSKPMLREGGTGDWIGTFVGHKGAVWSARISSEATQVVTASADCTVRVWSAVCGSEIVCFNHKKIVRSASISDQGLVLTGGSESGIRIFDQQRPDEPIAVIGDHVPSTKFVHWGPQDHSIVVSCTSDTIHFWDPRTPNDQPVKSIQPGAAVSRIEPTSDRKNLIFTSGKTVTLVSFDTLETSLTLTANNPLLSADVDPNNRFCVTGGADHTVRLIDMFTGEELECNRGHHGPVHCVSFAPDGKTFASGSEDGTIRIWLKKNKPYKLWSAPIMHSSSETSLLSGSVPLFLDFPPVQNSAPDRRRRNRTQSALIPAPRK